MAPGRSGGRLQGSAELVLVSAIVDQRAVQRRVVNLSAYAREAKAEIREVQIFDLSTDGCRIGAPGALEPGCEVWLKIPQIGAKRARIAWSREGEAGCEFDSPIEPPVIQQLLSTQRRIDRAHGRAMASKLRGRAVPPRR